MAEAEKSSFWARAREGLAHAIAGDLLGKAEPRQDATRSAASRTPIDAGLIAAVTAQVRPTVTGAEPDSWMGPRQPLAPQAPPDVKGRAWDFPVGINMQYTPRGTEMTSFAQMRALADGYDLLSLAIETRKDQLAKLKWSVKPRDTEKKADSRCKEIEDFFLFPDREHSWDDWIRAVTDEMLVTDAATIYPRLTRGGKPYQFELMDGSTIKRVIDPSGRTPMPPDVAYQQVLKGVVAADYHVDELIYAPRNIRTWKLYGRCFSPDTEILTRDGWKLVGQAGYADEFATRNPETHVFEWQRPVAVTSRDYEGDLVHFTAKSLDILVTPEHRMLTRCIHPDVDSRERTVTAAELARLGVHWQIPVTSDGWTGARIESRRFGGERVERIRELRKTGRTYTQIACEVDCAVATVADVVTERYTYDRDRVELSGDDYCAFMGMYLSEGSINKGCQVVITQHTTSKHFDKFNAALGRMFALVRHDGSDFRVNSTILAKYLKQFGHSHEKFVPNDIMNATCEQIETFLEHLFDGDAHRNPRGPIYYYTTSKRLADQVQELLQKIGKSGSIRPCKPRGSKMADGREIKAENCRVQYRVSVNRRTHLHPHARMIAYKGPVHCLSVPNQTVYVRRNGYAAWTKQSPVEQVIMTVNIAIRRQLSQLQFYTEGSTPDLILEVPDTWQPDQVKAFTEWWQSKLQGNTAARRAPMFVPKGVKPINTKEGLLKDEYDEWLARIICYAFSLSPQAFVKQMNRATAESAQEAALTEGLVPLMNWIANLINKAIWKYWGYSDLCFSWIEEDALDPEQQASINNVKVRNATKTINEVRADDGMDPIEGGDEPMIYTAAGAVLLKDVLNPPEPVVPPGDPGMPPTDESQAKTKLKPDDSKKPAEKLLKSKRVPTINRSRKAVKTATAGMRKIMATLLGDQMPDIVQQLGKALGAAAKADDPEQDPKKIDNEVDRILRDLDFAGWAVAVGDVQDVIDRITRDGGAQALIQIGIKDTDITEQVNARALEFAKNRAAELVGKKWSGGKLIDNPNAEYAITDGTRELLRSTVYQAIDERWSIDELATAIAEGNAFSEDRADLIARTEVARADVAGNMTGYRESGVVEKKVWLLSNDHDIDDECNDSADQGAIDLDEDFVGGDAPPAHPGCLCDIAPVVSEDDTEKSAMAVEVRKIRNDLRDFTKAMTGKPEAAHIFNVTALPSPAPNVIVESPMHKVENTINVPDRETHVHLKAGKVTKTITTRRGEQGQLFADIVETTE